MPLKLRGAVVWPVQFAPLLAVAMSAAPVVVVKPLPLGSTFTCRML